MQRFLILLMVLCLPFLAAQDILIKVSADAPVGFAQRTLNAGENTFSLRPLYDGRSDLAKSWYIATANQKSLQSPWDLAHQIATENTDVIYAEPDRVEMNEYYQRLARALTEANAQDARNDDWSEPNPYIMAWHLDDSHSQLRTARREAGYKSGKRVRVAHIDTGYSPENITTPEFLRVDLARNFVEGENANSAVDPGKEGIGEQPGHGTSTLSILAGSMVELPEKKFKQFLGGAPEVEIVPIRLSKTVILMQVSTFAQALFYAVDKDCDVVAMSMGGVVSKLWEEAVNKAYEHGITMVTAAGNNVSRQPTVYLVYPAKFKRVIAVCGITYNKTPYYKEDSWFVGMQGNWGTEVLMKSAIGAYTPNITSARFKNPKSLGTGGGGTSSATPQIAAAVSLWLQKYIDYPYQHPWQKVNAVRNALFSSADKSLPDSKKYFGNGVLRAADALKIRPKLDNEPIPRDKVEDPWLSLLYGWETRGEDTYRTMITIEMMRLIEANPELRNAMEKLKGKNKASAELKAEITAILHKIPEASQTVRNSLK